MVVKLLLAFSGYLSRWIWVSWFQWFSCSACSPAQPIVRGSHVLLWRLVEQEFMWAICPCSHPNISTEAGRLTLLEICLKFTKTPGSFLV